MNKKDRTQIKKALEKLSNVQLLLNELIEEMQDFTNNEQEKFDNLNEGLQESETGQALSSNVEILEDFVYQLESIVGELEEVDCYHELNELIQRFED